ncbi:MAG: aromatic ring-hydroxylating dioxygenase subunit alpha [Planctomycetota bacterium]
MELSDLLIDPEIARAETPPGWLYTSEEVFERVRARVLPRAWQLAGEGSLPGPGEVEPFELFPGALSEPLLLARDAEGALRCLSNVCTHRANLLIEARCAGQGLRCRYHGRRFDLAGRFRSMPEFEGAEGFPRPEDDLPELPLETLGPLAFTGLAPRPGSLAAWLGALGARLGFFPWEELRPDPAAARSFEVAASWALYLDNYLEGFHIPFVHPSLNQALDYSGYRTEPLEHGVLQLGVARPDEPAFELPAGHPDQGLRVGAYYAWLFPTTMLNLYPWGLSLNVIEPLGPTRTRVRFLPYVARPELRERGAGAGLDQVELEDEAVVEAVQRGVRARLYRRGRYSPSREQGVHRFHRLLLAALREPDA